MESNLYSAIEQLYGSVSGAWIVSGCTTSSINTVAKTCQISTGYLFLAGELRYFGGYVGTYPVYVQPAVDTYESRLFQNGVNQNVYVTRTASATTVQPAGASERSNSSSSFTELAALSEASGGGGSTSPALLNHVTFNPDNVSARLVPLITSSVSTSLAAETATRAAADTGLQNAITNEATTRAAADAALQTSVNNITAVLNTRAGRVANKIPWTSLPLSNVNYTTVDPAANRFKSLQYMRDEFGRVWFCGVITGKGTGVLATLPAEVRPSRSVLMSATRLVNLVTGVSTLSTVDVEFANDGRLVLTANNITLTGATQPDNQIVHDVFFDGFSYSLEA